MEIKTKYNIGDKVYSLNCNCVPNLETITDIKIWVTGKGVTIMYGVLGPHDHYINEDDLFKDKDEILEFLKKKIEGG